METNERQRIFQEELDALYHERLIEREEYSKIKLAYRHYNTYISDPQTNVGSFNHYNQDMDSNFNDQDNLEQPLYEKVVDQVPVNKTKPIKEPKPKRILSKEQIRERNITWTLILGVIMLLVSGLVIATNNWDVMTDLTKVLSIGLISIVFFIMGFVAKRIFKIEKTAFAFLVLATLFIPIIILSVGYFRLFGEWFSIYGEGWSLFGLSGALLCLVVYSYISFKTKSRLFTWFTFLTSSIGVGFLLSLFKLGEDAFYLGIMLFNSLLILLYLRLKNHEKLGFIMKELPIYSQLNLIISSLLMLIFFNNALFYSANVIITSILYISIAYVYKQRYYHFVFSAMIVYGLYQLIENSILQEANVLFFSLIGFLFLYLQKLNASDNFVRKLFQYTSAVISGCAFLFISLQAIFINIEHPSILMFFAYLLVATNFFFLAKQTNQILFIYLTPIFLIVAGFESWMMGHQYFRLNFVEIYMFMVAVILYLSLYLFNKSKIFAEIRESSLEISSSTMILTILYAYIDGNIRSGMLLAFLYCFITYLTFRHTNRTIIKVISEWLVPCSLLTALISTYEILVHIPTYETSFNLPFHLSISGLILVLLSYLIKSLNLSFFSMGQGIYWISLFLLFEYPVNTTYVLPLILLIGITMSILLVIRTRIPLLTFLVSFMTFTFYISLINPLGDPFDLNYGTMGYLSCAPLFLMLINETIGRKFPYIKPYFRITAQLTMLMILVLIYFTELLWLYPLSMLFYLYSILSTKQEWAIKLNIYLGSTVSYLWITALLNTFHIPFVNPNYNFFITSILLLIIWLMSNQDWKRRLDYYLVGFNLLGIAQMAILASSLESSLLTLLYILITLVLLHRRGWDLLTIIPLLFSLVIMKQLQVEHDLYTIIAIVIMYFLLMKVGEHLYKTPFIVKEVSITIDWYSFTSLLYLNLLYEVVNKEILWQEILPAGLLVYLFYSQIKRFHHDQIKKGWISITVVSIYLPYLVLLKHIPIHPVIEKEIYLLPIIIMTLFLSKFTWRSYRKVMLQVQTFVLFTLALIFLLDAYQSNTIWDVVVIGTLSLLSIFYGFQNHLKSYFLIGTGLLLLSLFLQTRPFWGNLPWWIYLLFTGILLIGIASLYEWMKQNKEKSKEIQKNWFGWIKKIKEWD